MLQDAGMRNYIMIKAVYYILVMKAAVKNS